MVDCGGGVLDGTGQEVEGVENYVLGSDLWLGEVFVEYLHSVADDDGFCCCISDLEAAVVLECGADGETFVAAEVPIYAGAWFGMDDDWDAKGYMGMASKLKGPLKFSQAEMAGAMLD